MYTRNEKILPIPIEDEMKESYISYAMSVIVGRALPDVRDGLKPVHRRILYAMKELNLEHNKPYKKSARIVGETLGKYHPHGDIAVYDALARMVQNFSLRYPLIDGQGNFGCFTKDTKIKLTDDRVLSFGELIQEEKKGRKNYTYTYNTKKHRVEIARIQFPRLTKRKADLVEVKLDNGEKVKCTPNHQFMLKNGTYKEAKNLKVGDSLMPLYTRLSTLDDDPNMVGYEMVYQPFTNEWDYTHRLADEWNIKHRVYSKSAGRIRHHLDFNKLNNNPENIRRFPWGKHWQSHYKMTAERHRNDLEYIQRLAEGRKRYWSSTGIREKYSRLFKELNKRNWGDPKYRKKMQKVVKKKWEDPEYKRYMAELASERLKKLWKRPGFSQWRGKLKSEELKEKWGNKDYAIYMAEVMRKRSYEMWKDPAHREYISRLNRDRWLDPEYKRRMSEKSKKQWQSLSFRKHIVTCYRKKWQEDPDFRKRFIPVLTENGKRAHYYRFLKVCERVIVKYGVINEKNYEKERLNYGSRSGEGIIKYEKALRKYFNGNVSKIYRILEIRGLRSKEKEMAFVGNGLNHKVVSVKKLKEREDVYDLTIEDTHNFALDSGIFVHNSIDGDAVAAMRYCITGDSLVVTEKGLQRIAKIPHYSELSFQTLSLNNKINHVSKWFDSGEHPTKLIETHRGFNLCGSLNHPILTWQNESGKPQFKWKLLKYIESGDYAVINRSNLLFPPEDPSLKPYYPELKNRCKIHKLPSFMNKALAFILGAIVSEGNIGKEQIGFCNNDKEFIEEFKSSFKKVFPDCRLHEFMRKPVGYTKKTYTSLEIHSTQVIKFLKNLGLTPGRAKERIVPEIIFQSSKESVASFLQAFAEGDGSVYISSSLTNLEISFISASKKLMQELQILLLRFGIDSSYRWQKTRNIFKLFIRNYENLNLFKDQIDFATERKKKKLEEIAKRNSSGWVMSKMDFIPYLSDYIRNKDCYRSKYWRDRALLLYCNIDRYTKIEKRWPNLRRILDEEDVRLYETLRRNRYIFDKVVSVKDGGVKRVYSIKVDSPCHSFVSNGFISHNTECRLAPITDWMLADIEKETVKFMPNFDDTLKEPAILPATLPNLLINGSSGIAVGMATNAPPHNLSEIVDGIIALIDKPDIELDELMKYIKGPDFPTGGIICGKEGIIEAYKRGRGRIIVHAKAATEELKSGKQLIVITEIPYQVNKTSLIESIAELAQSKRIEGISDIRDESDKEGMRIVVELRRDTDARVVLNQLYKHTQMQITFGIIMLALVNNRPEILNLNELITHYIEHRKEIVINRTKFDLAKAEDRAHILEGLKIALKNLDRIVNLIKKSKDPQVAKDALMQKFELSEKQAQAILEMQLQRLTGLEREKIDKEYLELLKKIEYLKGILESEKKILEVIKNELIEIKKKFGDERRTAILGKVEELEIEDLIAEENVVITISHSGYIKRLPVSAYRKQKRGGKGITGAETKEEDFIQDIFIASTHDNMLFFTNKGKAHLLKVYDIPQAGRLSKGKSAVNLLRLSQDECITSSISVKEFEESKNLVMVTKKGKVKKTALMDFSNIRRGGINAINLGKDDVLIDSQLTEEENEIFIATREGKAIRFSERQIRRMGRNAAGVRGINLGKKDEVVGMAVVKDRKATLLSVAKNGFGKKTEVSEYRLQSRGGKGIINMKVTSKNGPVVGLKMVSDRDDIVLITQGGMVVRCAVKDIRTTGRAVQGVRVIRLDSKDSVASVASVAKEEE